MLLILYILVYTLLIVVGFLVAQSVRDNRRITQLEQDAKLRGIQLDNFLDEQHNRNTFG